MTYLHPVSETPETQQAPAGRDEHLPTLLESMGGPWGIAESSASAIVFVVAYTASGNELELSAGIAVAVTALLALVRVARRESPRMALTGLLGVAVAAWFATRTGKAEDFFLPGLLLNGAYAAALLASIVAGWPAVGIIAEQFDRSYVGWRDDAAHRGLMRRATLMWAGMFISRLVVQVPMYLAGAVVALGVARTAMGVPLFGLTAFVTYRWLRSAGGPVPGDPDDGGDEGADAEDGGPGADQVPERV